MLDKYKESGIDVIFNTMQLNAKDIEMTTVYDIQEINDLCGFEDEILTEEQKLEIANSLERYAYVQFGPYEVSQMTYIEATPEEIERHRKENSQYRLADVKFTVEIKGDVIIIDSEKTGEAHYANYTNGLEDDDSWLESAIRNFQTAYLKKVEVKNKTFLED